MSDVHVFVPSTSIGEAKRICEDCGRKRGDPIHDLIPASVEAMTDGTKNTTPTAPLDEFLVAYEADDNWWWRISCGHHMNLFDAAIERLRFAEEKLRSHDCRARDTLDMS